MSITHEDVAPVLSYIKTHWHRSVRRDTSPVKGVVLPYPYTTPCVTGSFTFFFYWDTYFTNLGLIPHGELEAARGNVENMMYLIRRHGFMPNHVGLENRSQPPYFGPMVRDLHEVTRDDDWLAHAAEYVRQEYYFWLNARSTPTGLARHAHTATFEYIDEFYKGVARRLGWSDDISPEEKHQASSHHIAEAETGHDFTPRFDGRCLDFCPVDLNSNLYLYEKLLAEWSGLLHWDEEEFWEHRAATRAERMRRHMWNDERGLFLDYDFVNDGHSEVASLAAFHPLWAGLATEEEARRTAQNLPLFEREHGVAVCEPAEGDFYYQWGFPNAWPPLTYTTVTALDRYGMEDAARRVAEKYLSVSADLFEETGQLWEKTDAVTGEVAGGEYDAQPMLGWSAGVFVALAESLGLA